jgi:hypothetical protein
MKQRYAAVIWVPSQYSPSHHAVTIGTYRTRAAAERRIAALTPQQITRYNTSRGRDAEVRDTKSRAVYPQDYPEVLVPTVGELGYW